MSKEFEEKVLEFIDISKKSFSKIENKIDAIEERIDTLEVTINERIDAIEERIDKIEERIDKIEVRIDKIEGRLDIINERIDTLSSSVVLVEQKVMTEFPALFEAFELHQEMHKDYDEKNAYLSAKVEEDSMRISILEDQMKFIKNVSK